MKVHIERVHEAVKKYKCEICDKMFHMKRGYKEHVKRHSGERPYPCPMCDKRLASAQTRDFHVRTHFGENPYRESEQRRAPRKRRKQTILARLVRKLGA